MGYQSCLGYNIGCELVMYLLGIAMGFRIFEMQANVEKHYNYFDKCNH
jgi:hypothetical protein